MSQGILKAGCFFWCYVLHISMRLLINRVTVHFSTLYYVLMCIWSNALHNKSSIGEKA
jgi:hypothetical protein